MEHVTRRRLPVGAETSASGTHFRAWATAARAVDVVVEWPEPCVVRLELDAPGWWSGFAPGVGAGARYRVRVDGDPLPDPAARFLPEGPHGPAEVIDPSFRWTDVGWRGVPLRGAVFYELHVGTFTPEGTWEAAARQLPDLAELGVNVIELMPVAEFPGRFGWGYDGVALFAPTRLYGRPDDMRRFVDRAHACGIAVILDVVYNHFGPDGCYLRRFSPEWFTDRYTNEWGDPVNFDGPGSEGVRETVLANVRLWIEEYHLDGFRVDATQQTWDASDEHVVAAITRRTRELAGDRHTLVVAENEPQHARFIRPRAEGGMGMDAAWNDDFHHAAVVAVTGKQESYYTDYEGSPQEIVSALKRGYLFQGQWYSWQKQRRGTPTDGLTPARFVHYLQNHDQVANSAYGWRLHRLTSPGRLRAITAVLLLAPPTPTLFMGQEFAASSPFLYFADHHPELAARVREGRRLFLSQFRSLTTPEMQDRLADPADPDTFARSRLDPGERVRNADVLALHRDLLRIRREDPVVREQGEHGFDGAVLGPEAFVLRWFAPDHADRLLVVNLGRELRRDPAPEPLLAPPEGARWEVLWSSEDPRYGGTGTPPLDTEQNWRVPGHAAVLLHPRRPDG
ncbi:MAG: malto-oligosyltrehalose trehalohydrolase [Myxococcota bacterium]